MGLVVGFGRHGLDQLLEVVVGGRQGGALVVGADPEHDPFAVGVEQLQLAQGRGDVGGDDDLVNIDGACEPSWAQIEG